MDVYSLNPAVALLVFALGLVGALALAWPRRGVLAKLRRTWRMSERVRLEDAVKYLFHRGDDAAVRAEAVAGALAISDGTARRLLAHLVQLGLVRIQGAGFVLTDRGRADALRLVRTHRLVEQWLADRTGVEAADWHEVAEEAEHELSAEEVERLAAQLGQPRYDPHGDPIPTATGEMPSDGRIPLSELGSGGAGIVAHLEDEPVEDYATLATLGVALGKTLVVRDRDDHRLHLELDGKHITLPRTLESAVSVRPVAPTSTARPHTLAELVPGETGRVAGISPACHGAQRRRLLDLGVVPGTDIKAVMQSAGGDPMAYDIRGALIGLRRQQAEWILIDRSAEQVA